MLRKEWKFEYTAEALAGAAQKKIAFHEERLSWWKAKKDETLTTIRSEGLEVEEKLALGYQNPKSRDWERGAQVYVRNDLQKVLDECLEKLQAHTQRLNEYLGWEQVLIANTQSSLCLDIDDWLFFFGRESQ